MKIRLHENQVSQIRTLAVSKGLSWRAASISVCQPQSWWELAKSWFMGLVNVSSPDNQVTCFVAFELYLKCHGPELLAP